MGLEALFVCNEKNDILTGAYNRELEILSEKYEKGQLTKKDNKSLKQLYKKLKETNEETYKNLIKIVNHKGLIKRYKKLETNEQRKKAEQAYQEAIILIKKNYDSWFNPKIKNLKQYNNKIKEKKINHTFISKEEEYDNNVEIKTFIKRK